MTVTQWSSLTATLAPLVILLLAQSHWSARAKGAVVTAVSFAGGAVSVYLGGGDLADLAVTVPAVLAASQLLYHTFFKPTAIAPWLEQLTDLAALFGTIAAQSSAQETKPE